MFYNQIVLIEDGLSSFFAKFIVERKDLNMSIVETISILPNINPKKNIFIKQVETEKIVEVNKDFIINFFDARLNDIEVEYKELCENTNREKELLEEELKIKETALENLNNSKFKLDKEISYDDLISLIDIRNEQKDIIKLEIKDILDKVKELSSKMQMAEMRHSFLAGGSNKIKKLKEAVLEAYEANK